MGIRIDFWERQENNMLATKYKLTGRIMDGVKVTDYEVENIANGEHFVLPRHTVEDLALSKLIVNCSAQRHHNRVILKGQGCKLCELPYISRSNGDIQKEKICYSIIGRIVHGKYVIGYSMKRHDTNETFNIQKDKAIRLIRDGKVVNARVQSSNGIGDIVRGIDCDISKLPVLRVNKDISE